jgi:asparagine N-glycosylation enzyme membrane subunit Stt3
VSTLRPRLSLSIIVLVTLVLSGVSRWAQGRDVHLPGASSWITTDPDSLYQMRRVDRALSGGLPVAAYDDYLNYPEGSAIPWPPYYTWVAAGLVGPFAPSERAERRAFIEESVGSLALCFGVLATAVACAAGFLLAGRPGALVAGSYQALCQIAIAYSKLGNGDHHSFVTFVSGCLLLLLTWVLLRERLNARGPAIRWGALAGALVGLLLGAWVGAMLYVVQIELVLAWLILRQSRERRAGLASFGLALHAAAVLVLAPAVLASPWKEIEPWMVVNLSWFHPVFLALGGAVFLPLCFLDSRPRALRLYPWLVGSALALLVAFFALADIPMARALREGFAWAGKTNEFMAGIQESRSLFAAGADPSASEDLGLGLWALPVAWLAAAWQCFRRGRLALLPWVVSVPLLWLQAAQQARFAEALVLPMAVLLGWGASRIFERAGPAPLASLTLPLRRLPPVAAALVAIALVGLCHAGSSARSLGRLASGRSTSEVSESPATLAVRRMATWLAQHSESPPGYCVLANWSHGHTLEWAADRPTVATNFGSYVGEDSLRDPARFFMSEDPAAAELLLERRRARYVLVTSELPDNLNSMIALSAPEVRSRWVNPAAEGQVQPAWFRTLGARLMFDGAVFLDDAEPSLDFLRLVNVSALQDPSRRLRTPTDVSPAAWLWERVRGARVEAYSKPGTELRVWLDVEFPRARRLVQWRGLAVADADGRAVLRVPYATTGGQGEGRVRRGNWRCGIADGQLQLDEGAVQSGARVLVHGTPP